MRMTLVFVVSLLSVGILSAQTPPAFEVVSIRPSPDQPEQATVGVHISGAQVRMSYFTLRDYVSRAYRMRAAQIEAPDWLTQTRFDIAAKLPDGASADQVPSMLQTLLADSFELKTHRVMRDLPVYALSATKDGPKVASILDSSEIVPAAPGTVNVTGSGSAAGVFVDLGAGASINLFDNRLDVRKVTTPQLVEGLTRFMEHPVIDAVGLPGRYSFTITLSQGDYFGSLIRAALSQGVVLPPEALRALEYAAADPFSPALQKYGLTLEARKASLEVLVVDSIRRAPIER